MKNNQDTFEFLDRLMLNQTLLSENWQKSLILA